MPSAIALANNQRAGFSDWRISMTQLRMIALGLAFALLCSGHAAAPI